MALPFFGTGMKTDLSSPVATAEFKDQYGVVLYIIVTVFFQLLAERHGDSGIVFRGQVWASQVALVVKNLLANAGDIREMG